MTHLQIPSAGAVLALAFGLLAAVAADRAAAHFELSAEARVVHLAPMDATPAESRRQSNGEVAAGGLRLLIRVPGPLAYARELATRAAPDAPVAAPFIRSVPVRGATFSALDRTAIAADRLALARFLAGGYRIEVDGAPVTAVPLRAAYHANPTRPHFSDLDGALTAVAGSTGPAAGDIYVGDSVLDVDLWLPDAAVDASVAVVSALPEIAVPPSLVLQTLGSDHRHDPPRPLKGGGQLQQPIVFTGTLLASLLNFIVEGFRHIVFGPDHVLFVVCIALAPLRFSRIVLAVTGFTLGHSVTLGLGAFGVAPAAAWFYPTIELLIAASIIYAAVLLAFRFGDTGRERAGAGLRLFALTAAIGLIHGYGFASMLAGLFAGPTEPVRFGIGVIGFNLGVEFGQIAIVVAALTVAYLTARLGAAFVSGLRNTVALAAVVIASVWFVERIGLVAAG